MIIYAGKSFTCFQRSVCEFYSAIATLQGFVKGLRGATLVAERHAHQSSAEAALIKKSPRILSAFLPLMASADRQVT
ncbi:hypothetical protein F8A90_08895 [Cobetia sp. cqz5-12]|uniref:hypothetical protein n=1 Tax=Cobetia sp. cqz5-12 TaxID=2609415 RepID=UPI0019073B7B|nr:hypothetical protein [Cobetia sp. cqz5-12]QQK64225.1 hypothetical protein F8A90_08895 [Cobetia sp. cqz5-12]